MRSTWRVLQDGQNPVALALEWGVRRLGEQCELTAAGGPAEAGDHGHTSRRTTTTAGSSSPSRRVDQVTVCYLGAMAGWS